MTMARGFFAAIVLALSVSTLGCGGVPPDSIETPAGVAAYHADSVVRKIGLLQDVTIVLADQAAIDETAARRIVAFTVSAAKVAKAHPSGAATEIGTALSELIAALPDATRAKIDPYVKSLQTALAAIGG